MSVPEWTKDEQSIDGAKSYLRVGGTVDFFEMIARNILQNHPTDLPTFALRIVTDIFAGNELPADGEYHPKKLEDNQYMQENKVSEFLDAWVLALLEERPGSDQERMQFHKKYLQGLIAADAVSDNASS